jgi:hypothetical protein
MEDTCKSIQKRSLCSLSFANGSVFGFHHPFAVKGQRKMDNNIFLEKPGGELLCLVVRDLI